jgi:hypothetical protein
MKGDQNMKVLRVLTAIGVFALLALALTPGLKAAQVWNQKTTMTFSQPVEIPGGEILPAGTYVFKIVGSPGDDRNIVQISSEDERQNYAIVLVIANERMHAAENTIVTFAERAAGSPQAIKVWFHPGDSVGHEFVYPKVRAVELAKEVNEPIPAVAVEPAPVAEMEKEPIVAEMPSGEEVPVAKGFEQPVEVAQALPQTATLPKTASSLPLIGLIGLMSLAAAFTLLLVTKRIG